ncbi:chromosome segregation protein SMC [Lactobacillus corticis]|uniref:Chromosome partition protein Smc n=1 Tax=Lactobacillus corticis TaxID=2201249 RepID=A0A916QK40_9LACO|nr:chromosome segregation protein SMC [Lactobacillus corticis]GFZ27228.1 chromosome segregation protein SMC [Lactobacillus corticis]
MPLTELIINGFKSFADETTIHFSKGITGIVGPNGSGKSNITEAIRWVMGEASAKSLRGSNMKDVIFAGSDTRPPLNRASVTLVFDNSDHGLSMDSEQVAVSRRILRAGESEYLINNQQVRLKDVRALFLDSGISQNSLAIISQGRVDQILNSRPEERRVIFEEAAGVLHFKEQKHEAELELERTNDNLIRINDLVKELSGRLEPLHEQSSLAKEYKFQKAGLDAKLKTLLAFEISDFASEKDKLADQAARNQQILTKLDTEVKDSQAKLTAQKNAYNQLADTRQQLQEKQLELTQKLSEINTKLQVAEQSEQFDTATKDEYQKQLQAASKNIQDLTTDIAKLRKASNAVKNEAEALTAQKTKLQAELKEDPAQLAKRLEDTRSAYIQTLQDQTSAKNELAYLQAELERAKNDHSLEAEDSSQELVKAKQELEELRKAGETDKTQRTDLLQAIKRLDQATNEKIAQVQALRQQANQTNRQLDQVEARHEALVNIQKRHEGYYFGVRNVLNHLDQFPGVIGAVGELITFPAQLEAAITTALGGGVQDLITESRTSARDSINRLKQKHAGRATFLPLDGLRNYAIPSSTIKLLEQYAGFQGIASDLVAPNSPTDISAAINYLLGTVIVVDTIETALEVQKRVNRYRIITLDGDVIAPGGSMTGGERNRKNNSPLQTSAEIRQLQDKIAQLQKNAQSLQEELSTTLQDQEKSSQELEKLKGNLQELNQTLSEEALSYQNQAKEVKRLEDAQKLFTSRKAAKAARISEITRQMTDKTDRQTELADLADKEQQEVAALEQRIKNFNEASKEIQAQVAQLDPKIAVLANKSENLKQQIAEKTKRLTDQETSQAELKQKLTALAENGELSDKRKADLRQEADKLDQQKGENSAKLAQLSAKLGQFDAKISQLDQVATRNYDLRKDAALEQEQFSVKIAKLNEQINQRLDTLSNDYQLTYEAALDQAAGENTAENRQKLAREVKLHKMSLEDIGPVNLSSIQEYEDVKERYDFLHDQQDDLIQARSNLEASMSELDSEVKNRFNETFTQIAASFKQMFPQVFGGGEAKLILTDPDDLLTTGVEIIAQPPGKKLQRLSLLSGGERALTAITLLFAMLQVSPVPFCVLDEVEAALDETNVTRFARFMQKYDLHTQFIVITHRRGMMQQADQLFGVVMQESGVSKVLSVSLKDIKDEVE